MIVAPKAHPGPKWWLRVEEYDAENEVLYATPHGGGFRKIFPPDRIDHWQFREVSVEDIPEIYQAEFTQDAYGEDVRFLGWTTGELWNGWATPVFEYDQAMRIQKIQHAMHQEFAREGDAWKVDDMIWEGRTLVRLAHPYPKDAGPIEITKIKPYKIKAGGRQRDVYGIGDWEWCWEEVEPEEDFGEES